MPDLPIEITTSTPFNVPDRIPIPDVKGFGGRVRNLKRVLAQTCQQDAIIVAETAGDAIVDTMWMFLTLDSGEVLEEYLDPRNARNSKKGKRGANGRRRRTRRGASLFWMALKAFNLNGIVARLLPGKRLIRAFGYIPGVGIFFRIFNVIELGLFGWLLFEAADNFVMKWMSGLQEGQYCTSVVPGLFVYEDNDSGPRGVGTNNLPMWQTGSTLNPDVNEGWNVFNAGRIAGGSGDPTQTSRAVISLQGGSFTVTGQVSAIQIGVQLIVNYGDGESFNEERLAVDLNGDIPENGTVPEVSIMFKDKDITSIEFIKRITVSGINGAIDLEADWIACALPGS